MAKTPLGCAAKKGGRVGGREGTEGAGMSKESRVARHTKTQPVYRRREGGREGGREGREQA